MSITPTDLAANLQNRVVEVEGPKRSRHGFSGHSRWQFRARAFHDGGRISFGPDGKLYIGTGDSANGPLAQNLQSMAGKILRVNQRRLHSERQPVFRSRPSTVTVTEMCKDSTGNPLNGKIYETEHGPTGEQGRFANDEVNEIEPGGNYGWPLVICKPDGPRFVDPVFCTGDNETWAPSGCQLLQARKDIG